MKSAPFDPYQRGLRLAEQGLHAQAIVAFEKALANNPNDVRVLFALANTARALGQSVTAEKLYVQVLALAPDRMEVAVSLANLLREKGRFAEAEGVLKPALHAHPQSPELWMTLGLVYREAGNDEQAIVFLRHALELRPEYIPALGNLADILCDQGQCAETLSLYETILNIDPNHIQTRFHRGIVRLLIGDLAGGWADYQARLSDIPNKVPAADHGLPRWSGRFCPDMRLLITAEQGVGDQIMFASLFPQMQARATAAGAHLILECEPRLVALFARSFAPANVHPWQVETRAGLVRANYDWLRNAGGADAFVEMGSLPGLLRNRQADFPRPNAYLQVAPDERSFWASHFEGMPKPWIGICWRSGKLGGARTRQYASFEMWGRFLAKLPGTLVVAQYDAAPQEITTLETLSGKRICVPPGIDQKNELDRTAAMLNALDVVISAPTAVSWLAAGSGVPVHKILNCRTWTAFGNDYEPFAPAARCHSPMRLGDWSIAFASVLRALAPAVSPTEGADLSPML